MKSKNIQNQCKQENISLSMHPRFDVLQSARDKSDGESDESEVDLLCGGCGLDDGDQRAGELRGTAENGSTH
jgi:hypothetical protein